VMYGALSNYTPSISDTQGNIWIQANKDTNEFQYVGAGVGGPETITLTFPDREYAYVIIGEFSGSWELKDVIPPRCLPPTCGPLNGAQSLQYNDNTSMPSSLPLTTTQPNELVFGYGNADSAPTYNAGDVIAGTGWTLVGFTPNRMLQFTVMANPGVVTSTFNQPFLPEGIYATEGIVAFRSIGCGDGL
jgi:hypothetical protein